jgi:hypothetical protein
VGADLIRIVLGEYAVREFWGTIAWTDGQVHVKFRMRSSRDDHLPTGTLGRRAHRGTPTPFITAE